VKKPVQPVAHVAVSSPPIDSRIYFDPVDTSHLNAAPVSNPAGYHPVQSECYQNLLKKTNFDSTEAGKTLQKYLHPLESVPLDPGTKNKMALAQAREIEGLTADKVLATFDGLKVTLKQEEDHFNDLMSQAQAKEVDGRQAQINSLSEEINAKQAQLVQLSTDMASMQNKIQQKKMEFSSAVQTRASELDQQKAHYQGILQ
jgi:hypothetical protein